MKTQLPQQRGSINGLVLAAALGTVGLSTVHAAVEMPNIFGDHMVLQRHYDNPIWGWADPQESITVEIAGQKRITKADAEGAWKVKLNPMEAGGPHQLTVKGSSEATFEDVMVGEVWICSGQSNMQWPVSASNNAELEILAANHPNIRIISVPQVASQEPRKNFDGQWERCSPDNIGSFSGVGYFFGRRLHDTLQIPIGLIDNAWGGSAAEAWVRRDILEGDPLYSDLMARWEETESSYDHEAAMKDYEQRLEKWRSEGQKGDRPRQPRNPLASNHRPANIYNGVLHPTIGYGMRGVIWYQGESNAGRAYQYRDLFPTMIQNWRNVWGQGDFSFYWVQLADYMEESGQPEASAWAELREAQTMTMNRLDNTGQAVIIDVGEGRDIHPRDKQNVAARLARWALAKDYGYEVQAASPMYQSMEKIDGKIRLTFDHVGPGLYTFDVREPVGFAIAGPDKNFVWAKAELAGTNQIDVWSDSVDDPVAVRYAWANNPVCNVYSRNGLPLTPFRTDDWEGVTANARR